MRSDVAVVALSVLAVLCVRCDSAREEPREPADRELRPYQALVEEQAGRKKRGLSPAVVLSYGVSGRSQTLEILGREGRGGYFQESSAPPLPSPEAEIQGFRSR